MGFIDVLYYYTSKNFSILLEEKTFRVALKNFNFMLINAKKHCNFFCAVILDPRL